MWGLDAEGELQGVWRRTGHPRLWIAMGKFSFPKCTHHRIFVNVGFTNSQLFPFSSALVASRASYGHSPWYPVYKTNVTHTEITAIETGIVPDGLI